MKDGEFFTVVPAKVAALEPLVEQLDAFFEAREVAIGPAHQVLLCLDEIFANVAAHAYPQGVSDPSIRISARTDGQALTLIVCDDGIAFNPLEQPEPDTDLLIEDRPVGGLGIFLVRKLMDDVSYQRIGAENRLTIVKRLG